ncbi:hypothetical protein [Desulfonauticus submarinus]
MEKFSLNKKFAIEQVTPFGRHHFFGYYDVSPWSNSETKILTLEVDFLGRTPEKDDIAGIGIVDLRTKKIEIIGQTKVWNWQQGARLQWLGPDFEKFIIYNDRSNNQFISIILDTETGKKETLPLPIYSINQKGDLAVTLNFARLQKFREGYGYEGGSSYGLDKKAPEDDGIYLLNLKTKEKKLIVSLKELFEFNYSPIMENSFHWVNHLMFSPSGEKFIFFHRFYLKDGGLYTRLFEYNLKTKGLKLLLESDKASHFSWKNDNEIIVWARMPNKISSFRKNSTVFRGFLKIALPVYHLLVPEKTKLNQKLTNDSYLLINTETKEIRKIGQEIFKQDGHCSISKDEKWMLTDTYSDKNHYRHLFIYNLENKEFIEVGKFYSLPDKRFNVKSDWDISGMRTDLHPRFSKKADKICIDSVHSGTRQIFIIKTNYK